MEDPTEEGYYVIKTTEGRVGIALWQDGKFWQDAHQDNTVKFGIKRDVIVEWEKSSIQPELK